MRFDTRQLYQLFENAPILVCYAEKSDLEIAFANKAFRRLYHDRQLVGLPALRAIPEAEEQGFGRILREVISSGQPWHGHDVEVRIRCGRDPNSISRFIDFLYQPVKSESGEVIGVLCAGSDVTERNQAYREAERLRHQVLHSSRVNAMGTMAMTLAHEINQPLAAASNYLATSMYLARPSGPADPVLAQHLELANSQILRAGEVIRRARSVIRNGEAVRNPVSLDDALDRTIALLEAGGSLRIQVNRDIGDGASMVQADEVQLEQVLMNLIRNASVACRNAPRREAIFQSVRIGDFVAVSIRDFGPGLPDRRVDDLFAPSAQSEGDGLGIGLSLCRTLIEANGGELRGENADGGGAIFTFSLAAAPAA
jgi:two-component system, LuxR family, sensor kinase FixL